MSAITSTTGAPDLTNLKALNGALKTLKADQKGLNKDLRGVAQIHKQITEINKDYTVLDKILCVVLAIIFPVIGTFFAVKKWKNIQAMQQPRQVGVSEMTVTYGQAAAAGLQSIQKKVSELSQKRQELFPNTQIEFNEMKARAEKAEAAIADLKKDKGISKTAFLTGLAGLAVGYAPTLFSVAANYFVPAAVAKA